MKARCAATNTDVCGAEHELRLAVPAAPRGGPPKMRAHRYALFRGRNAVPALSIPPSILELFISGFGMRLTLRRLLPGFLSGAANRPQELAIAGKHLARLGKIGPQGLG